MKSRFFNPYVGKRYHEGFLNGKKVLVLGASYYCPHHNDSDKFQCPVWNECTSMEKKDSSKFNDCCPYYESIGWIQEYGTKLENSPSIELENFFESPTTYRSYYRFTRFIIECFDCPELKDTAEIWDKLSFMNYVQYFLPTTDTPDQDKTDIPNFAAFLQTLDELVPDIVIIWSTTITNHFKQEYIKRMVSYLKDRDNDYYWDLEYNGSKYLLINPWHPSDPKWWAGRDGFYEALKSVLLK